MEKQHSAGGVITRTLNGSLEILLVMHRDKKFGFPKGHIEAGENEKDAAQREIIEETGYSEVIIGEKMGVIERDSIDSNGRHVLKDIVMFRAEISGDRRVSPDEDIVWVGLSDAMGRFWYAEDNAFFNQIMDRL